MSKFIGLQDGPYIPANCIIKVTGPEYIEDWCYVVAYKLKGRGTEYHTVHLNKTFVTDEIKASDKLKNFIAQLNQLL